MNASRLWILIGLCCCCFAEPKFATAGTLAYTRDRAGRVVGTASSSAGSTYSYDHSGNLIARNSTVDPTPDLSVSQSIVPDAPTRGVPFYIYIDIVNLSSHLAVGVQLLDNLPSGLSLVGASSSQGTNTISGNALTYSVGTLEAGAGATLVLQVLAAGSGSITNTAALVPGTNDQFAGNNNAVLPFKILGGPVLSLTLGAQYDLLSWQADAGSFVAEETTSLTLPISWSVLPSPSLEGGTFFLPVTPSRNKFYRLRNQ